VMTDLRSAQSTYPWANSAAVYDENSAVVPQKPQKILRFQAMGEGASFESHLSLIVTSGAVE